MWQFDKYFSVFLCTIWTVIGLWKIIHFIVTVRSIANKSLKKKFRSRINRRWRSPPYFMTNRSECKRLAIDHGSTFRKKFAYCWYRPWKPTLFRRREFSYTIYFFLNSRTNGTGMSLILKIVCFWYEVSFALIRLAFPKQVYS